MTEQEVAKVLYILNLNYQTDNRTNASDMEKRLKLWAVEFRNEDAELVTRAVQVHISNSKWYPTIAEIKQNLQALKEERYYLTQFKGGTTIRVGNKTYHAGLITEIELTPEEDAYLEKLWQELVENEP